MRKTKIAITYEKGGVGKTTTAVNLAAILAEKGFRVLLVDLDPQSYATAYFDLYNDLLPSITGVMMGRNKAQEAIRPTKIENLDILPGSYDFKDIETYLMMKTRRQEYTLRETMADVSDLYDFILMDCPPSGNRIKTNALAYADYVLLPTIPDDYAIHGLLCMANELVEIRQGVNPSLDVLGVLITIYEKTSNKKAYTEALQGQDNALIINDITLFENAKGKLIVQLPRTEKAKDNGQESVVPLSGELRHDITSEVKKSYARALQAQRRRS